MTKALVLGGTKFVGKNLVANMIAKGVDVTIATRGNEADPFEDKVTRIKLDRENGESVKEALSGKSFDIVFDHSCYSPQEVKDVLDVLSGHIGKYVFISTSAVYDFGEQLKEEEFIPATYPISYKGRREYAGLAGYQEAKRISEAVLYKECKAPVVTVRFPYIVGEDDYTKRFEFHVKAIQNEEPIGVSNPEQRFGFIDSQDAATFLWKVAMSEVEGPINAGSLGDVSMQEMLERISKAVGKSVLYAEDVQTNRSPYDLGESLAMDMQYAHDLGFEFSPIEELQDRLIAYFSGLVYKA